MDAQRREAGTTAAAPDLPPGGEGCADDRLRRVICLVCASLVAVLSPARAAPLFEDDFAADTLAGWEVVDVGRHAAPSSWTIADGALHQTSNIYTTPFNGRHEADWTGSFLVSRRGRLEDGEIDTLFWSTDDDGLGVVWRYTDKANYCKVQIDSSGGFWQISKTVDGTFTCLAVGTETTYIKGRKHRLQVRVEEDTAAVYLDGRLLGAAAGLPLSEGAVGFESRGNDGSHFDHIRVSPLSGTTDRAAVSRCLLRQATASVELSRLAVLPGEELALRLNTAGETGRWADKLAVQVRSPSGQALAERTFEGALAGGPLWRNTDAAPGLYRLVLLSGGAVVRELPFNVWEGLPQDVGVCAHRGDNHAAPENTLPAFRLAVEKGAHQIELDVRRSKDGRLVIMHDGTVDRTTDGSGAVAEHTFEELRKLDAGSWKDPKWAGVRIPTLREVLELVPPTVQLNCHLRPGVEAQTARQIVEMRRLEQCFLACGTADAEAARQVDARIRICNMQNQSGPDTSYPQETIDGGAEYIQLMGWHDCMPETCARLRAHGVTINYFGTSDPAMFRRLIEAGVQYPLTDDLDAMLVVLRDMGIPSAAPDVPGEGDGG